MKHSAFTSGGEHNPFLVPQKLTYLQNFQAFADSALADEQFTSIIDFLDCINQKANEIVSQAGKEGFKDTYELQMDIFDLARRYAGLYASR